MPGNPCAVISRLPWFVLAGACRQLTGPLLSLVNVACDEALRQGIVSFEVEGEYCNNDDYYSKQDLSDSRAPPIGNISISQECLLRPHRHIT